MIVKSETGYFLTRELQNQYNLGWRLISVLKDNSTKQQYQYFFESTPE